MGNSCVNAKEQSIEQQHHAFFRYTGLEKAYESLCASEDDIECPICHSDSPTSYLPIVETKMIKFPECGHAMHSICLLDWFRHTKRPTCPMCRRLMKGVKFIDHDDSCL